MRCAVLSLALAVVGAYTVPAGHVLTPSGPMPAECVHAVPNNAAIRVLEDHTEVLHENGTLFARLPLCSSYNRSVLGDDDLPADYDGWLEYAAFQDKIGFDTFLGTFSVPDKPAAAPAVLYIFTGLQNIDWIPKVDPEPAGDFDIIQPVLQYPGDLGNYWSVKSWYVTLKAGALYSPEIQVPPGDSIFGNMTRIGPSSYYISSEVVSTGKSTVLRPQNTRLASQPWSYVTLECYGCLDCSTYPVKPTVFSKMSLTLSNGQGAVTPSWLANPSPAKDRKCAESLSIQSPEEVTIFFNKPAA